MPRSGTFPYSYSYPAGTPGTSGAPISSTAYNNFLTDLQNTLNGTQPLNLGGTGQSTAIGGWDVFNSQGNDVPTTTSIDLTLAGPFFNLTGTTTVTSITLGTGKNRSARASGVFQLTASANLVVNGSTSTSYTTAAGDYLIFEGGAAGVVYAWSVSITYPVSVANGGTGAANLNAFVRAGVTNLLTVGYTVTPNNVGTVTTGTTTLNPALGQLQYMTNNGASTIASPASDCEIDLLITNSASAGSLTLTGFTVGSSTGSALTTTNTSKFIMSVRRINSISTYSIYALQ